MSPSSRLKLLPLLIALASAPAGAVGLGEIELHSQLGKPLDAVVPLSHLGELGADQLKIGLGTQEDYNALGVEFTYQHTQIKLEPIVKDGRSYIRLVTRDPINEPYLNFVLNLRWPQGQVVREYTALLDPPEGKFTSVPRAAAAVAAARAGSEPAATAATTDTTSVTANPAPAESSRPAVSTVAGGDTYQSRSGDSLWKLAARWRPAGVSVDQMMGAIHSANPDAFVANDPSRLRALATLQVPTSEQIAAAAPLGVPAATPSAPAPEVAAEPVAPTPPSAPPPGPSITTGVRDEELVAENAELKRQVQDLTTNVAALTTNLDASQDRLHELEGKLGSLIDQLERQRVATQALATAAGIAPAATESLVNNAIAGDLLAPAPAKTPWWVHASYWAAIAALGAWLVFTQLWRRRSPVLVELPRDDRSESAHNEIKARLVAEPLATPAARTRPAAEADSYWQPNAAPAAIDELPLDLVLDLPDEPGAERPSFADATVTRTAEDAVDPIISAGVFTAFGRFDDAEQVLTEALQRQPERVDLKLHLLDVYKHQDKRAAFIALADTIEQDHADDEAIVQELAALRAHYLG
jgi:pilus assembly protein FimV